MFDLIHFELFTEGILIKFCRKQKFKIRIFKINTMSSWPILMTPIDRLMLSCLQYNNRCWTKFRKFLQKRDTLWNRYPSVILVQSITFGFGRRSINAAFNVLLLILLLIRNYGGKFRTDGDGGNYRFTDCKFRVRALSRRGCCRY